MPFSKDQFEQLKQQYVQNLKKHPILFGYFKTLGIYDQSKELKITSFCLLGMLCISTIFALLLYHTLPYNISTARAYGLAMLLMCPILFLWIFYLKQQAKSYSLVSDERLQLPLYSLAIFSMVIALNVQYWESHWVNALVIMLMTTQNLKKICVENFFRLHIKANELQHLTEVRSLALTLSKLKTKSTHTPALKHELDSTHQQLLAYEQKLQIKYRYQSLEEYAADIEAQD